jgi:hypothetical protein
MGLGNAMRKERGTPFAVICPPWPLGGEHMDPQKPGDERQGSKNPGATEPRKSGTAESNPNDSAQRQQDRDRQNKDDPSRAPESGDPD